MPIETRSPVVLRRPVLRAVTLCICGLFGAGAAAAEPSAPADAEMLLITPEVAVSALELELRFRGALADEEYESALIAGEALLPEWERRYGSGGARLVERLTGLGRAQRKTGQLAQAERTLDRAVDIARAAHGPFAAELVAPMTELAHTHREQEEHMLAVATYTEAQGLSRRTLGLLNLEQVEMLDGMATSLMAVEAYGDAMETAREALLISERHHGPESPELLPALYRTARWYRRGLRFVDERDLYMRIVDIAEQDGGEHDLRIVPAMRALAGSLRDEGNYISAEGMRRAAPGHPSGQQALRRALDAVRAQHPPRRDLEARLLVDLGDWSLAQGRRNTGNNHYIEAWEVLAEAENGAELRDRWFGEPFAVTHPQPSWLGIKPRGSEAGLEDGIVVARYRVNAYGRAQDVEVIESRPEGLKDSTVRRTLNRMRFRPYFEDGEPSLSDDRTYEFRFGYEP